MIFFQAGMHRFPRIREHSGEDRSSAGKDRSLALAQAPEPMERMEPQERYISRPRGQRGRHVSISWLSRAFRVRFSWLTRATSTPTSPSYIDGAPDGSLCSSWLVYRKHETEATMMAMSGNE